MTQAPERAAEPAPVARDLEARQDLPRRLASLGVIVLPPWLTARVIVLGALALAHLAVDRTHPATSGVVARVHQGLLGWDAGWYEAIARYGYGALGHGSLRFFPLVPMLTRTLAVLPGVSDGAALIVVANAASLAGTALVVLLVHGESGDRALARRTAWLLSLLPPAFTQVMGYAEGPLLVFVVGCFLALRSRGGPRWWWAAAAAYLAALTRPLGVLLVLPIAVEAVRWWVRSRLPGRVGPLVALAAPVAGLATFLGWSAAALGNALLPLRVQTQAGHHGGLADPLGTLVHDASGAFHHHFGTALHVPWVLVALAVLVLCWLRLPSCYSLFATGVLVAALSGTNLDSFERYALSAFPLVWAASLLTSNRQVERVVLSVCAAGLAAYAFLAFTNLMVP